MPQQYFSQFQVQYMNVIVFGNSSIVAQLRSSRRHMSQKSSDGILGKWGWPEFSPE